MAEPSYGKGPLSSILMIGAFAGLIVLGWFAFEEAKYPADSENLPIIKRNPAPYKEKPIDPGGMEIPYRGKQVFNTVSGKYNDEVTQETERNVRLLPPPEEPLTMAEIESTKAADLPDDVKDMLNEDTNTILDKFTQTAQAGDGKSLKIVSQSTQKVVDNTLPHVDDIASQAVVDEEAPLVPRRRNPIVRSFTTYSKTTGRKQIGFVVLPHKPSPYEQVQKPAYTSAMVHSAEKIGSISGVKVQLGSFRSAESLRKNWTDMKSKYYTYLRGLDYSMEKVDLGAKGVFYRLHAGPFDNDVVAEKLCKSLKQRQLGCFVVRK